MVFNLDILYHPVVFIICNSENINYIIMGNSTVNQWLLSYTGGKVAYWLKNYVASQQPGTVTFGII